MKLQGYKTYIVSGGMIAYAVLGMLFGYIDSAEMIRVVLEALGLSALRNGTSTDAKQVKSVVVNEACITNSVVRNATAETKEVIEQKG